MIYNINKELLLEAISKTFNGPINGPFNITFNLNLIPVTKLKNDYCKMLASFNKNEKVIEISNLVGNQLEINKFIKSLDNKISRKKFVSKYYSAHDLNIQSRDFASIIIKDKTIKIVNQFKDYDIETVSENFIDIMDEIRNLKSSTNHIMSLLSKTLFHPNNILELNSYRGCYLKYIGKGKKVYELFITIPDGYFGVDDYNNFDLVSDKNASRVLNDIFRFKKLPDSILKENGIIKDMRFSNINMDEWALRDFDKNNLKLLFKKHRITSPESINYLNSIKD